MTGLQALQSLRTDPKSATLPLPLRSTNFEFLHRKITCLPTCHCFLMALFKVTEIPISKSGL